MPNKARARFIYTKCHRTWNEHGISANKRRSSADNKFAITLTRNINSMIELVPLLMDLVQHVARQHELSCVYWSTCESNPKFQRHACMKEHEEEHIQILWRKAIWK